MKTKDLVSSARVFTLLLTVLALASCTAVRKAGKLQERRPAAALALPEQAEDGPQETAMTVWPHDSLNVHDFMGRDVFVMNAVRDESSGEMVANETLQAARVTARFRNVAERGGRVDLLFQIVVPAEMQDSRWQLRFHPRMEIQDEVVDLDDILITGKDYRKAQLRGYQQYERFLRTIVTDSTRFIDLHQLEVFIRRNIPALYAFRNDSSAVSDSAFASVYGVTERQAIEYYTYRLRVRRNERRIRDIDKMFRRYVKAPLQAEHLRLDTVIVNESGAFVYNYVQPVATRPKLRKVDIRLDGEICEQDRVLYTMPESDPLTFYISSLSTLADGRDRYLEQIVSRRVDFRQEARLRFALGDDAVDPALEDNSREIAKICTTLAALLDNETFGLDSIVVTAHASPEGSWHSNAELSQRRGRSVGRYFAAYMRRYADSLHRERGVRMTLGGAPSVAESTPEPDIRFSSYAVPENWEMLDRLVGQDTLLSESQKQTYRMRRELPDPDLREAAMRADDSYAYVSEVLYPQLRHVLFDFLLYRKNMQQDTLRTTVPDTVYRAGVQALRDRDYQQAVTLLRPYADYNAAIAYTCLDYNASALSILEKLDRSASVNYLMAILHARQGDESEALSCYRQACGQDRSFVHRGNLDPEISALVRKYGLNQEF